MSLLNISSELRVNIKRRPPIQKFKKLHYPAKFDLFTSMNSMIVISVFLSVKYKFVIKI